MNPPLIPDLVLLVEDDADDAFFFQRAYGKSGFKHPLHVLRHGLAAIHYLAGEGEYADRHRYPLPTLVVLDINLPARNGLEVLQWIRGQRAWRSLVVVVLTSSNSELDIAAAYAAGVNSYLLKPAEPSELVRLVEQMAAYWLGANCLPGKAAPRSC